MDHSRPAEVEALLAALEAADRAPLHPLVVIWVSSYCGKSALCAETETRILKNTKFQVNPFLVLLKSTKMNLGGFKCKGQGLDQSLYYPTIILLD